MFEIAVDSGKKTGLVKDGDLVVITAGLPVAASGKTNVMRVHQVGEVLTQA
jgi:pyruvate kinase